MISPQGFPQERVHKPEPLAFGGEAIVVRPRLTPRCMQLVGLLCEGHANKEIAYRMGFIDAGQLSKLTAGIRNEYGDYLRELVKDTRA